MCDSLIEHNRPSIKKYERVINTVKSELLGERELMKQTNLKQHQIRIIKADLLDQGIIREVMIGKSKKYEFVPNSKPLNTKAFEELRNHKLRDLEQMIAYVETSQSRMKFLCEYLGDNSNHVFNNCDNTGKKKIIVSVTPVWAEKLQSFRGNYFLVLEVESKDSNIVNGIAASYYGASNVGSALHRCKYEQGGDFPDFLVEMVKKAFQKKFGDQKFDLMVYVPPTSSGDLVKNFAIKVSKSLNIPISYNLIKTKQTKEQKVFENTYLKIENVNGAFTFKTPNDIEGKNVLLIDDIFDSGATIKEIGKLLTKLGAAKIAPIVIAKTVGGDIV